LKTPFAVNTSTRIREASFSSLSTARACALGNTQYLVCLHSTGGFLSTRSTALNGNGWPTIPMLPVCSMTTRANAPSRSRWPRQKGTVIEQSADPGPLSHSVIHSSDWNLCSSAATGCMTAEATITSSQINSREKRLSLMIVVCLDRSFIPPPRPGARQGGGDNRRSTACSTFPERRLRQAALQGREVDAGHLLVLVEAGKDDSLGAGRSIPLQLQASRVDLVHHALHRRVDRDDRPVPWPELAAQVGAARLGDGVHPSQYPFHGFDRNEMYHVERPRGIVHACGGPPATMSPREHNAARSQAARPYLSALQVNSTRTSAFAGVTIPFRTLGISYRPVTCDGPRVARPEQHLQVARLAGRRLEVLGGDGGVEG